MYFLSQIIYIRNMDMQIKFNSNIVYFYKIFLTEQRILVDCMLNTLGGVFNVLK